MKFWILIIEDDSAQRQMFKSALEGAGYEVLEAANGQTGLALYEQHSCDVVISDIFMPVSDGLETIFELKSRGAPVKIIAISGGGSWTRHSSRFTAADPLEIARRFGADRVLKKPLKIRELLVLLKDLLKTHEPHEDSVSPLPKPAVNAKKRILVIDDDDAHRHLFVTALKQSGRYEVLEASNGVEGLEVFQQQPCDLVICDIFMPQKEGLETIFELRQYAPHVRVIAISGGGRWAQHGRSLDADEPLDMARRFGAAKALKKPVKIQELLKIVSDLLRK